jgi:hypothetical protein
LYISPHKPKVLMKIIWDILEVKSCTMNVKTHIAVGISSNMHFADQMFRFNS